MKTKMNIEQEIAVISIIKENHCILNGNLRKMKEIVEEAENRKEKLITECSLLYEKTLKLMEGTCFSKNDLCYSEDKDQYILDCTSKEESHK